MGLEPTTLRDLVRCSNHWTTEDSVVSKGQFVGIDWNHIAQLHSQVSTGTHETHWQHHAVSLKHIQMQPTKLQSEHVKYKTTTTW